MARSRSRESSNKAARRLLQSVVERPSDLVKLPASEIDLALRLMRRVRLLGWLAERLDEAGVLQDLPEAALEQLESARAASVARVRLARWELNRIAWALASQPSLQVVVLKGCAYLLRELPNAIGRLFADVDLLVAEDDLGVVEASLAEHGWQAAELTPYDQNFYRAWSHELPAMVHIEREVEVDVHHNIRGRYAPFQPNAVLLLQQARPIDGTRFQSLSDVDIVLHAMTHFMFGGDQADALRDLVDIDSLLRHFAARDDAYWDRLGERARELDLVLPAFYSLRYTRLLLKTAVPERVAEVLSRGMPNRLVVAWMDRLVPLALFPPHPDARSRRVAFARWLLYMRSHWVSMPPLMLLRHLSYKFYVRHLQGRLNRVRGRVRPA